MNNHKMLTKRRTFLISCVEWVVVSHRGNEGSVSSPVKDLCRGYFKGATDITDDFSGQEQLELHSIEVRKNPLLLSVKLEDIRFEDFHIQIQYLRRPNMLEDIEPRPDIILLNGDALVILGLQKDINKFEKYIGTGKISA